MTIDLLVVNYKTKDKLQRLLETLNSDYEEDVWKLYVADNDSQDGSLEFLRENQDKYRIEQVFKNPNVGYGTAVASMSTIASSDFLCAVNADTWFSTNHVKQAEQTFLDNPNQAIMGPKQRDEQGKIRHGGITWTGIKGEHPIHRGWGQSDPNDTEFKDRTQVWTVSGSIYYVRRSVWDVLTNDPQYRQMNPTAMSPMLDGRLFMYFEETYVSVFAQHRGYEVWYDGSIEGAGHSWHASNTPGDNVHWFQQSREIYRHSCDRLGINHEII